MRIDGQVGGYPVKFLEQIVRLSKILKLKREKIGHLRELNSHGERKKSFGAYINEDFQRKYASTVIELSTINRDLNEHLKNIQDFTQVCDIQTQLSLVCFLPMLSFCLVFKKTQGHLKKTQGPFWAKNSTYRRLIPILPKNLKKFHIQITIFHGGNIC